MIMTMIPCYLQSIAAYTCLPSFSNYGNENTTIVLSTCLEVGVLFFLVVIVSNINIDWEDVKEVFTYRMMSHHIIT